MIPSIKTLKKNVNKFNFSLSKKIEKTKDANG